MRWLLWEEKEKGKFWSVFSLLTWFHSNTFLMTQYVNKMKWLENNTVCSTMRSIIKACYIIHCVIFLSFFPALSVTYNILTQPARVVTLWTKHVFNENFSHMMFAVCFDLWKCKGLKPVGTKRDGNGREFGWLIWLRCQNIYLVSWGRRWMVGPSYLKEKLYFSKLFCWLFPIHMNSLSNLSVYI